MRQLEIARRQLHFFQTEGAYLNFAQKSLCFVLHKQLASSPTLIRLLTVKLFYFEKKICVFFSLQMLTITLKRGHTQSWVVQCQVLWLCMLYFQLSLSEDGRPRLKPNRRFSLSPEVLCFCRTLKLY